MTFKSEVLMKLLIYRVLMVIKKIGIRIDWIIMLISAKDIRRINKPIKRNYLLSLYQK